MAKVTVNKSLSARIKLRNRAGFKGEGTKGWVKTTSFGDYKSLEYNNKEEDIKLDIAKKNKVGFRPAKYTFDNINPSSMTKKYADKHQKVTH